MHWKTRNPQLTFLVETPVQLSFLIEDVYYEKVKAIQGLLRSFNPQPTFSTNTHLILKCIFSQVSVENGAHSTWQSAGLLYFAKYLFIVFTSGWALLNMAFAWQCLLL